MKDTDEILQSLTALRAEVLELRDCIIGRRIKGGPPGLMTLMDAQRDELYGNEEQHRVGLKQRLESLEARIEKIEEAKKRLKWTTIGWAGAISSVWPIAWFLANWLKDKP